MTFGNGLIGLPFMNTTGVALLRWDNTGNKRHYRIAGKGFEIEKNGILGRKLIELQQLGNEYGATAFKKGGGLFKIDQASAEIFKGLVCAIGRNHHGKTAMASLGFVTGLLI